MHKPDRKTIDKHLLQQFLAIYEANSVSRAAEILDVNQSSISHALERLRKIVGDPLFVRSGRGIIPTERAHEVAVSAREIVAQIDQLIAVPSYQPELDKAPFTIMSNDYEIETVIKPNLIRIREQAPFVTLRIVNAVSGRDIPEVLRTHAVDLVLNPDCDVDASDVKQKRLFSDTDQVFYDGSERSAPLTLDEYCAADHAMMVLGNIRVTEIEKRLLQQNRTRRFAVEAPTFSAIGSLIRGTDIIATMPTKLSETLFSDLQMCPSPVILSPFSIMQMWHTSMDNSPRNRWFRSMLSTVFERSRDNFSIISPANNR